MQVIKNMIILEKVKKKRSAIKKHCTHNRMSKSGSNIEFIHFAKENKWIMSITNNKKVTKNINVK